MHDTYASPLEGRYASRAMLELWSPKTRHGLWRRLWLALAEAEQELGAEIPNVAISQMRQHLDDIDFDAVAAVQHFHSPFNSFRLRHSSRSVFTYQEP